MTSYAFVLGVIGLAIALSVVMTLAWCVEQRTRNSGWIDTIWTFGLGVIGAGSALFATPGGGSLTARQWLVAAVIAIWSVRLGSHIALRSARRADDPRYAELRAGWGGDARWQMWLLLQKQAIVTLPMSVSIWLAAHNPAPELRLQDYIALIVVLVAIAGEALADWQLQSFVRKNGNHSICDIGLWRLSRHPNYFFEWLAWLAYPLIAIDLSGAYPFGWLALAGPACMYWLLVYVSGIPPLEQHMLRTRGDAFRQYQLRTNAFFPLPPSVMKA